MEANPDRGRYCLRMGHHFIDGVCRRCGTPETATSVYLSELKRLTTDE